MEKIDLNELTLASFNELKRIKFLDDKKLEDLDDQEIYNMTAKIYEKLGDKFLEHTFYIDEDGQPKSMAFKYDERLAYIELILLFSICHLNKMDLNLFFDLNKK